MSVPYNLQEYIELYGNQLSSEDRVWNTVYKYTGQLNYFLNVYPEISQHNVDMLISKCSVPNISVKVWTQINGITQGNYICSLRQPSITRQRKFELNDIGYDWIKDKIYNV